MGVFLGEENEEISTTDMIDIIELKNKEFELQKERNLFSTGPVIIIIWENSENWPVRYISENSFELLGYHPSELKDEAFRYDTLIHPDDLTRICIEVEYNIEHNVNVYEQSYRLRRKSGEYIWVYDFTCLDRNKEGLVVSIRGYMFDQTHLKNVENSLKSESLRLENIIRGTNVGTWEWNIQTGATIFNERWANIIGYSLEEISPVSINTWAKFANADDLKLSEELLNRHINKELDYYEFECRMKHKDGHWIWVLDRGCISTWTEDGKPLIMSGTHQDITFQKNAEEQLKASEEKYRLLFENMTNCFSLHEVIIDKSGEPVDFSYVMVNKAYEDQMKQSSESVVGKTILQINPAADKEMIRKYCKVGLTRESLQMEYYSKTFKRYFSSFTFSPQIGMFATVFEDITQRKKMQEDFATITERLKVATKAANVGIWEYDMVNVILVWDDEMYNLYDLTRESFLGTYAAWELLIHPDDLENARQHLQDAILGIRDFNLEYRILWQDGSVHHIKANAIVVHDDEGKVIKMIGTNWDVTESVCREEELFKAKEQADAANVMKSQFLANMSHEIRTPMNGILGYLELLSRTSLGSEQKEYISEAKSASELLLYLINDILDFSKIEAGKLTIEDTNFKLRTAVEDAVSVNIPKANEKHLKIHTYINSNVPEEVIGDPARLRQIINNLVSNAVKFTNEGEISVKVSSDEVVNGKVLLNFEVEDTGIGISKDTIDKLFKPFTQADSSTTRKFGGTGLGLAISRELVKLMGGDIFVESIVGKGSEFMFSVCFGCQPKASGSKTLENIHEKNVIVGDNKEDKESITKYPLSKGENDVPLKILLVEDNEMNRKIVTTTLNYYNLSCDTAVDGVDAVKAVMDKRYDIIFMDCQMPEMDGYECTAKIREIEGEKRHTKIIAMTANAMEGDRKKCIDAGMDDYISKPLNFNTLYKMIQECERERTPDCNDFNI